MPYAHGTIVILTKRYIKIMIIEIRHMILIPKKVNGIKKKSIYIHLIRWFII